MKIWVKFVHGTHSQKILATCLFFTKVQSTLKKRPPRGVFRENFIRPWPPLLVARIAKLNGKVSKIEAWPPLLQVGNQAFRFWARNLSDFRRKMARNLSEDLFFLFFFCSSPDFGRKLGRNLSVTISNSDLCSSQIF